MWQCTEKSPPLEAHCCEKLLVSPHPRNRLAQGRAPQELTLNILAMTYKKHCLQRGRCPLADL